MAVPNAQCKVSGEGICAGCHYFTTVGCSYPSMDEDMEMVLHKYKRTFELLAK